MLFLTLTTTEIDIQCRDQQKSNRKADGQRSSHRIVACFTGVIDLSNLPALLTQRHRLNHVALISDETDRLLDLQLNRQSLISHSSQRLTRELPGRGNALFCGRIQWPRRFVPVRRI